MHNLNGTLVPMQLICGGKAVQSLPKFDIPKGFSLFANLKQYSNNAESIKHIKEVFIP